MQSFMISFNAIFPVAAMIVIGILLQKFHLVKEETFREMNRFVFQFCIPVTLFLNIADADLSNVENIGMVVFAISGILILLVVGYIVLKFIPLENPTKATLLQDVFRTNVVILGLPIIQSIYGAENLGPTSILIAWTVPISNFLGVIALQLYSSQKANLRGTIISVLKNPLIIGALIGAFFKVFNLHIPTSIMSTLRMLNSISTPLALIALGGLFQFSSLKKNAKILAVFSILKLLILPGILLIIAILLGFRGVPLASLAILFGGPVAVTSFSMAVQMKADSELAAEIVVVTSLAVLFTFVILLTLLGNYGYL
ncbi:MAG: AEC family transporter [Solobacterium sp.]|nr:AEC family transporter [Solobacterium sp.]